MFDSGGMLILPRGAAEEFDAKRKQWRMGKIVECRNCNHRWRSIKKGNEISCPVCKYRMELQEVWQ